MSTARSEKKRYRVSCGESRTNILSQRTPLISGLFKQYARLYESWEGHSKA